jgi:capsular exopolysaccharide synthesis family protein
VIARRSDAEPYLAYLFGVARRQIAWICAGVVIFGGGALALSLTQQKQYSATAQLLFRDPKFDQTLFGAQLFTPPPDPSREAATNKNLVSLPVVARIAARQLPGSTGKDVMQRVAIDSAGASDIVLITATDPSPSRAAALANAVAAAYIQYRRDSDRAKIFEAQRLVQAQLDHPDRKRSQQLTDSLRSRSQDLQVLADMQTGNAELAQPATRPTSPSVPKTKRNVILGILVGALLGFGIGVLRERLDRRLRDIDELEPIFGRPVLAVVPQSPALDDRLGGIRELPAPAAEPFRALRANLMYFNTTNLVRSVIVVSAGVGEGKTTVAWYLAAATADAGQRVLLIESDLRRPALAQRAKLGTGPGLSLVLSGQAEADSCIQRGVTGNANLDVLPAGHQPPNPTDLLESPRFRDLIDWAEREYEFVVVDSPPVLVVADAIPLLSRMSGVVAVAKMAKTTTDQVGKLHRTLENLGAPVMGIVANGSKIPGPEYYGGYYYAPGSDSPDSNPEEGRADTPSELSEGVAPRS